MNKINYEIAREMLRNLPEYKKEQLEKRRDRQFKLTSDSVLHDVELIIYKEGFELICSGCRTQFTCYFKDNDGVLEFQKRRPNRNKLTLLYEEGEYVYDDFYMVDIF